MQEIWNNIVNTDWIEATDVAIRSIISLVTLFLITKMLGKKQVSQLSVFDYVIGISIGNFAAEMAYDTKSQYINGVIAVIIFGIVAYLVSYLTMKSMGLRRYFMGTPTILIQDGKLLEKNMKKARFDMNDLLEECRINGYFDISEIEYAVMEVNGNISILPKAEYKPLTSGDMQIKINKQGLCTNAVIDGVIMKNNLKNSNLDEEWFRHELKIKGYHNTNSILLATIDIDRKVTVYERNENEKPKDVLE